MTKLEIVKFTASCVVGTSTAYVTNAVIENNVEPETTNEKINLVVGSMVIGSMVAHHAKEHVDRNIDKIAEFWQSRKSDTTETVESAA